MRVYLPIKFRYTLLQRIGTETDTPRSLPMLQYTLPESVGQFFFYKKQWDLP